MSDDWKTLRVPKDAYEKAKEQKEDENRTWGEQIVQPVEDTTTIDDLTVEELQQSVEGFSNDSIDMDEIEDRIVSRLARETQADLQTVEKKLDQIQSAQGDTVSDALEIAEEQNIERILSKLDELEPSGGNITVEDIQTAMRTALRQELPDRVLQG